MPLLKIALVSFFIVLCSAFSFQTKGPIKIVFPAKYCKVQIDGFGNCYIINNNEISKYNVLGILLKKFSSKRYGTIDFIDVTNPLKILVYFKNFQQILFLDNQLTESSGMITLENIGYEQVSLVCSSTNNSFWAYNKQNNELLRFDATAKLVVATGNLNRLLSIELKPNFIKEHNGYLYLNCPNEGILVFDIYGTFTKTIPLKHLTDFGVNNGNIYFFENGYFKEYEAQTFNTKQKQFSDTLIKSITWQNNTFYKIYADSLVLE